MVIMLLLIEIKKAQHYAALFNASIFLSFFNSNSVALEFSPKAFLASGVQYFHYQEFNSDDERLTR